MVTAIHGSAKAYPGKTAYYDLAMLKNYCRHTTYTSLRYSVGKQYLKK
jgi:hypothetical protein